MSEPPASHRRDVEVDAEPRVEGLSSAESITVDGVPAAKVTAKIMVSRPDITVTGDDMTVIVIASAPQTYAIIDIPIGYPDLEAAGKAIVEQLKVAKDV